MSAAPGSKLEVNRNMSTLEARAANAGMIFAACLIAFLVVTTLAGAAVNLR